MLGKYRDKNVDEFMGLLEDDLTAIVGREFGNLDVRAVLDRNRKENPELSMDEALILAMRDKAAIIMRKTIALATSLDRTTAMVKQMAESMENEKKAKLYLNRLPILTNFNSILKQLW